MTYFKYTNGEAFTLDGLDYTGFFTLSAGGDVYTGKRIGQDSRPLVSKNNFISEFYSEGYEFDVINKNIESVVPYYSNTFDLLNKQELDKIFGQLNRNNLMVFKNLVLQYPKVFNLEESVFRFYSLSSSNSNPDVLLPSTTIRPTDTFERSENWKYLDNVVTGSFIVDSKDNFVYHLLDDGWQGYTTYYTISGNFSENSPLRTLNSTDTYAKNVDFDDNEKKFYIVTQDTVEVYDTSNYPTCQNYILTDIIPISASRIPYYIYKWNTTFENWGTIPIKWDFYKNPPNTQVANEVVPEFIRIGRNTRVEFNSKNLFIFNKDSTYILQSYTLDELGISAIKDIDVRSVDDAIVILHEKNNNPYVTFIENRDKNTLQETAILDFEIQNHVQITFSPLDSNIFYLVNNDTIQTRAISFPTYPAGKINVKDFLYISFYIWNLTYEKWDQIPIKWSDNNEKSNSFNNLKTIVKIYNNSLYVIIHNVGRIYTLKHPLFEQYFKALPLDVTKKFHGTVCSDSSVGLYINNAFSLIIKDLLTLYTNAKYQFKLSDDYPVAESIRNLEFENKNLYLNGNETINIISFQRILGLIVEIQKKLIAIQG